MLCIKLCLVRVKAFSENIPFFENAIFRKGKYFHVFGYISKKFLKNIFWHLEKKKEEREDDRFWGATIAIGDDESGFAIGAKAKSKGEVKRRRRMAKSKSNSFALWVRSLFGCDLSGRSLAGRRGVLSPFLFFLYLTLTQLSLSLCFPKNCI